jgi:hypothetical protein
VPTFVAGLFGMNVANFFEESTSAFVVLVAVCVMDHKCGSTLFKEVRHVHPKQPGHESWHGESQHTDLTIAKYGLWKLDKFRKLRF